MDFIVLGAILGGLLVIGGSVLRDAVPARLGPGEDDTPWVTVRDRRRTARTARTTGRVLVLAGAILLAVTVVLALVDTSDGLALAMVVGLAVVSCLVCAGWVAWYRYQESSGAIQRRQLRAVAVRLGPVGGAAGDRSGSDRRQPPAGRERDPVERRPADRTDEPPQRGDRRAEGTNGTRRPPSGPPDSQPVLADGGERPRDRREVGDRERDRDRGGRVERRSVHDAAHAVARGRAARPAPTNADLDWSMRPDPAADQRTDERPGWSTRRDPAERR